MPAPRKFDEATCQRAVRLYRDRLEQHGESKVEARRQVGALLDINPATISNWVEAEERAAGSRPAASTRQVDTDEVRALKRRVAELERANDTSRPPRRLWHRRSSTADSGDRGLHR